MTRTFTVSISVVCVLIFAFIAIAQNAHLEKIMLYPEPNADKVSPLSTPGGTDDITWNMVTPCPQEFNRGAIGQIGNYVYIFGSYPVDDFAQAFNLNTESWENSTPPPVDGCNWVGVVANGEMYVFPQAYFGSTVQKFTPTGGGPTGTWTTVAPYPIASMGVQAVAWDGGNYIYCAGGYGSGGIIANAYKYDIANNTYTQLASAPRPLRFVGAAFIDGKFYAVGGMDINSQSTDDLYEYDPATDIWTEKAPSPIATSFTCWATTYNDQYLIIVGGGGGYSSWPAIDAVQIYNPADDSWFLDSPRPLVNVGTNTALYCTGVNWLFDGGGYDGSEDYSIVFKGLNPPGSSNPAAPAASTNFTVDHNNAALEATLNWINPALTVNGQTLTQLLGVKILRNGNQIADLTNVQIGQPSTYNDNSMTSVGIYNYRAIAYNDSGDGLPAIASAWIGLDTPGEPQNVIATPDPSYNLECTITWDSPTQGAHGGYWPAGSWTGQKVYRDGEEIADLTGTNTSYVDSNIPAVGSYTYCVSYYNSSGESPQGYTPEVWVGPLAFEEIPYDWVEINTLGINTGLTGDDQNLGPFPIGFDFPFYNGNSFNSIRVCSNGFATFTSTVTAYSNASIPSESQPNNVLAVYWDDLQCNVTGAYVYYYHDAANGRFIVEWENVKKYGVTGSALTFEIILYPNGNIDYMYHTVNSSTLNSATVGIEDNEGEVGLQITYNGSGPIEPQENLGIRIYSVSIPPPDLVVTLTPFNPPIQIPANGGQFEFNIEASNTGTAPITFDVWTMATLPNGATYGPIINAPDLNINAGASINRDRSQAVPAGAPAGAYTYDAYVGDYPSSVWAEDHFDFEKLETEDNGPIIYNWNNFGEYFDGENEDAVVFIPTEYRFYSPYPNPFNPTTTIAFELRDAGLVSLRIFDVQGRQVACLNDGHLSAGKHEFAFDASRLSSGMYFAKIEAGDFKQTRKLLLMK